MRAHADRRDDIRSRRRHQRRVTKLSNPARRKRSLAATGAAYFSLRRRLRIA
jgi:hypothetical protein